MVQRLFRSPFFRFAAAFPVLLLALVVLVLLPVYRESAHDLDRAVRDAVDEEFEEFNEHYQRTGIAGIPELVNDHIRAHVDREVAFLLRDPQGKVVAGNLDAPPHPLSADGDWLRFEVPGHRNLVEGREGLLPDGSHLLIGRSSPLDRLQRRLARQLMLTGTVVFAASLVLGWLFTRLIARRLDLMRAGADRIQHGDLNARLPLSGARDELDQLAAAINRMLRRIELLMESARHISSSIAHDMRRPLSVLRIELDELAREPGVDDEFRSRVERSLARTDEVLAAFAAILRLARIEAGAYGPRHEPVALHVLAQDAIDLYQAVAEQQGREIRARLVSVEVAGDRDLLFQAVQNVIENALAHGRGAIEVSLVSIAGVAELRVRDHGPGVPEAVLPRVFERFFRVDESRAEPGSGVGLALVRAIIELHGGTIVAHNAQPGLEVTITLG